MVWNSEKNCCVHSPPSFFITQLLFPSILPFHSVACSPLSPFSFHRTLPLIYSLPLFASLHHFALNVSLFLIYPFLSNISVISLALTPQSLSLSFPFFPLHVALPLSPQFFGGAVKDSFCVDLPVPGPTRRPAGAGSGGFCWSLLSHSDSVKLT